jgi:hypothetical protein
MNRSSFDASLELITLLDRCLPPAGAWGDSWCESVDKIARPLRSWVFYDDWVVLDSEAGESCKSDILEGVESMRPGEDVDRLRALTAILSSDTSMVMLDEVGGLWLFDLYGGRDELLTRLRPSLRQLVDELIVDRDNGRFAKDGFGSIALAPGSLAKIDL